MVGQWHAVQRNNFEFSTIELKINIAVGGGIDDAPELAFAWVNADRQTNLTVHSENSSYFIRLASARRSLRLHATQESGGIRGIFDGLATYDKHLLAQVTNFRGIAVHSFNHNRPGHAVERLATLVAPPAPIALLGVTYKAEVDDVRESPALRIAELAVERGFSVRLCDPHVKAQTPGLPAPLLPVEQALRDAEAIVLLVDHRAFQELDVDLAAALVGSKRVLDARNALDRAAWQARGFEVSVLGAGSPAAERVQAGRSSA